MSEIGSRHSKVSRQSLWIRNSEAVPVALCVEPWANEIQISSSNDYQVVFEGPEGGFPGVEWGRDRITLYGWPGSVAQVLLGSTVVLSCSMPVPKIPQPRS